MRTVAICSVQSILVDRRVFHDFLYVFPFGDWLDGKTPSSTNKSQFDCFSGSPAKRGAGIGLVGRSVGTTKSGGSE
jgi:hypothetical protein